MKLARTLDKGLAVAECSEPAGDRPREGGEVVLFWLFSNLARRLRTPGWPPVSFMMAARLGDKWRKREVSRGY